LSRARSTWPPMGYSLLNRSICNRDMGSACCCSRGLCARACGGRFADGITILEIAKGTVRTGYHALPERKSCANLLVLVVGNTNFHTAPACHAVVEDEDVVLLDIGAEVLVDEDGLQRQGRQRFAVAGEDLSTRRHAGTQDDAAGVTEFNVDFEAEGLAAT